MYKLFNLHFAEIFENWTADEVQRMYALSFTSLSNFETMLRDTKSRTSTNKRFSKLRAKLRTGYPRKQTATTFRV